jgi:hypothetical protein
MIRLILGVAAVMSISCCYAQTPLLAQQSLTDLQPSSSITDDEKKEEITLSESRLRELRHKRTRNYLLTGSLMFLSGAADGLNQALQFRYDGFKRMFPKSCDQFWDPRKSGANKYKYGDPEKGAKFPGSKTWLVFVTDGYHLTRFISHLFMTGAIGVKIAGYEKKRWYKYLLEVVGYWVVNRVGFSLVYNRF